MMWFQRVPLVMMLPKRVIPHWLQSDVKNSICITLSMPSSAGAAMAVLTSRQKTANMVPFIFWTEQFLIVLSNLYSKWMTTEKALVDKKKHIMLLSFSNSTYLVRSMTDGPRSKLISLLNTQKLTFAVLSKLVNIVTN